MLEAVKLFVFLCGVNVTMCGAMGRVNSPTLFFLFLPLCGILCSKNDKNDN
jgi:hypothetical protein